MRIEIKTGALHLAGGQTLRVTDAVGCTVCCDEGTLWITEENQQRDVILEAGACMRMSRPGLTLLHALKPASVSIA